MGTPMRAMQFFLAGLLAMAPGASAMVLDIDGALPGNDSGPEDACDDEIADYKEINGKFYLCVLYRAYGPLGCHVGFCTPAPSDEDLELAFTIV